MNFIASLSTKAESLTGQFFCYFLVGIIGLAQRITFLAGGPPSRILQPGGATPPERYVPDTRRAREELGLKAAVDLDDATARTLAWHMAL